MSAQIVVNISSDEEDNNAAKRSTKTRPTAQPATIPTRTIVKTPSRAPLTADKAIVSGPVMTAAGGSKSPANTQPRNHQSTTTATATIQREQEAPKDPTLPAVQTTSTPSTTKPSSSLPHPPTTVDEPPKPTPLDINAFRHLVCAGSVPAAKDSPLIMSIQPVASTKRKAADALDDDSNSINGSRRPRPVSPLPPTPYTGTSERPVLPKSNNNSLLWSVPAYRPPPPLPPIPSTSTSNPSPSPLLKQPSIPNIHAPLTLTPQPPPPPFANPPQTATPLSTQSIPTPTAKPPTSRPRRRESKWTHAQLANLASAIETAFAPAMEAFAKENKKTLGQVRETYSFLVNGRIFEFSDEGREAEGDGKDGKDGKGKDGGGGKRRGGRGVARRFEREMRGGRKAAEKLMNQVHKKEASEGHWASLGMPPKEREKCKARETKQKQNAKKGGMLAEGAVR